MKNKTSNLELRTLNSFKGRVIKGLQVGAKFGIATANIEVIGDIPDIEEGVYYCRLSIVDCRFEDSYDGILHIGELKTFGREKTCEVHLLDFNQDIYGEMLDIEVLKFVRPTKKFQNADALYTQIERDVTGAEKYFLRQAVYQQWDDLSKADKALLSAKAIEKISTNDDFLSAQNIFIYAPQQDREIDFTESLMAKFSDKKYFFPKVMGEGEMEFFEVQNYADLETGQYGILEPNITNNEKRITNNDGGIVFVPAVAVDNKGNRLGKGGGFYDRWLASLENAPKTMVVLPKFSIIEKVPVEAHDQPVNEVIGV